MNYILSLCAFFLSCCLFVGVWGVRICTPPNVLSHPGGPGPPASKWTIIHVKFFLSAHVFLQLVEHSSVFQGCGDLSGEWAQWLCGMSKFTQSIIWHEALKTTAERKAAAIVLPCHKSCNPSWNTMPSHTTATALLSLFLSCLALHQKHSSFRNIPPMTVIPDTVILLLWKQQPLTNQPLTD